ncbi:MAG: pyridoxine 5'-phosphate synthase, partial [Deltaproteobacteria bacterium]|nr:pyridoxine 5'-phosphate synthase [Deltaproteobacteria bacterium]
MARLAVNVDHVATVRQARGIDEPDPVMAAGLAELAGADGIICHLREDRRHINDRDLRLLKQTVKTKLNLEMAAIEEMVDIALSTRPDLVTLVPEKREELTTEGGLDVMAQADHYVRVVERLKREGILISFFVDPHVDQIKAAKQCGADIVEIHTGHYAEAVTEA